MKVIIAGTRTFNDYSLLERKVNNILKFVDSVEIVSGAAPGADKLGERYAREHGFEIKQFPADWSLGAVAGPIRNNAMAAYADALILFWNGVSPGSRNMLELAKLRGLKVRVINY